MYICKGIKCKHLKFSFYFVKKKHSALKIVVFKPSKKKSLVKEIIHFSSLYSYHLFTVAQRLLSPNNKTYLILWFLN